MYNLERRYFYQDKPVLNVSLVAQIRTTILQPDQDKWVIIHPGIIILPGYGSVNDSLGAQIVTSDFSLAKNSDNPFIGCNNLKQNSSHRIISEINALLCAQIATQILLTGK